MLQTRKTGGLEKVHVTEVNKALLSASRIVKAGNRVVFDVEMSYTEDKSIGEKMYLEEWSSIPLGHTALGA